MPLFTIVAVSGHFVSDERLTNQRVGGLVIGFSGVVVLMAPSQPLETSLSGNLDSLLGSLAIAVASVCYAIATVIGRRNLRRRAAGADDITTQVSFGALALAAGVGYQGGLPTLAGVSPFIWASMLWLGAVGSGLAYSVVFHAAARGWVRPRWS